MAVSLVNLCHVFETYVFLTGFFRLYSDFSEGLLNVNGSGFMDGEFIPQHQQRH